MKNRIKNITQDNVTDTNHNTLTRFTKKLLQKKENLCKTNSFCRVPLPTEITAYHKIFFFFFLLISLFFSEKNKEKKKKRMGRKKKRGGKKETRLLSTIVDKKRT